MHACMRQAGGQTGRHTGRHRGGRQARHRGIQADRRVAAAAAAAIARSKKGSGDNITQRGRVCRPLLQSFARHTGKRSALYRCCWLLAAATSCCCCCCCCCCRCCLPTVDCRLLLSVCRAASCALGFHSTNPRATKLPALVLEAEQSSKRLRTNEL